MARLPLPSGHTARWLILRRQIDLAIGAASDLDRPAVERSGRQAIGIVRRMANASTSALNGLAVDFPPVATACAALLPG